MPQHRGQYWTQTPWVPEVARAVSRQRGQVGVIHRIFALLDGRRNATLEFPPCSAVMYPDRCGRPVLRRGVLTITLLAVPGCFLAIDAIKHTTVNMEKWDVSRIAVGLRGEGICPRARVQLVVFADAKHVERDKTRRFETWAGDAGSSRVGKMGFDEFVLAVDGGSLDVETGWFTPNPDVLATAATAFTIDARYKRQAHVPAVQQVVPPSYACITDGGIVGDAGMGGDAGPSGNGGSSGGSGGTDSTGGRGGDGTGGGAGGNGGPGSAGGSITAYATMVRTPHHGRLGLVVLEGDAADVVLFDPALGYALHAAGGPGGAGGSGGAGGPGGNGGNAGVGGAGGNGGAGGPGGVGGDGGPGGSIVLVVDARHPELAEMIRLDASGGPGGSPGSAGAGGRGGPGGSSSAAGAPTGTAGAEGAQGAQGRSGRDGPPGATRIDRADLAARFAHLPEGVALL
jgi:hypothetical protein